MEGGVEDGTDAYKGRAALYYRGEVRRGCGRRVVGADCGLYVGEGTATEVEAPHAGVNVCENGVGVEWALEKAHTVGWLIRALILGAGKIDRVAVAAALSAKFANPARKASPNRISTF